MTRRSLTGTRGQSLAELAFILPLLLVLVLGSIDLGRLFYAYISVTNGARNGATYASASADNLDDTAAIRDAVLQDTTGLLDTSETNPDVAVTTGTDSLGYSYAEVRVTYTFSPLFPWPGIPSSIEMERAVRAMVSPE